MEQLPFEQLHMEHGVIQTLTEKDKASNILLRVRWRGGLMLKLSHNWDFYWISVEKDDTVFECIRLDQGKDKDKYVMEKLQKVICSVERGQFARKKSTAELVAETVQKRQLTGCMNNTRWDTFRNAMLEEMPFRPPYEIKSLFDEEDAFITEFITSDAWYQGCYDAEDFASLNYKVIEYLVVKTRYYDETGGRLMQNKVWHDATDVFIELMEKYHIPYTPYEKSEDTYIIYGYRK